MDSNQRTPHSTFPQDLETVNTQLYVQLDTLRREGIASRPSRSLEPDLEHSMSSEQSMRGRLGDEESSLHVREIKIELGRILQTINQQVGL